MRIISPLLKRVVYPGLSKAGYLRWPTNSAPAVLTYHGVLPQGYSRRDSAIDGHLITADELRAQLRLLKSKYNVISPEEFRCWLRGESKLPERSVLLTCDDGLLNTLTDMLPVIDEFDVPFLFFVTGASINEHRSILWHERLYLLLHHLPGRISLRLPGENQPRIAETGAQKISLWQELIHKMSALSSIPRERTLEDVRIQIGISENWVSEYSQNEILRRRFFMLNRTDLTALADAKMTIGAHTVSHPMLSQMIETEAFSEIAENKKQLESAIGAELWALAYPFGTPEAYGFREASLAERAGFSCAFTNSGQFTAADKFRLPRIHISHGMSLPEMEARLCGLHRSLQHKYSALLSRGTA